MVEDFEHCYRAVQSRDPRFDGWFFTAVTSTGIYCRPSCPARTPAPRNVRFYPSAAAAQLAGFRACLRCRPDAVPGSPEWNVRADACARAMRMIADGVVDREGVAGLAARLGYSPRHLHRLLVAEVGAGPSALARAQRVQTARLLIETTDVPMADVAFAAGFDSVRQFNDTVRQVLGRTPSVLRGRRPRPAGPRAERPGGLTPGTIALRLPHRRPMATGPLLSFLAARAIPGVEAAVGGSYVRTLRLPHGEGVVALSAADGHVAARLALTDLRDLSAAVGRCRRLLDLDADPEAVDAALGGDTGLGPLVRALPGLRVPGAVDGFELAVRAVVGQQVSVAAASTVAGRLAAAGPVLELQSALTADERGEPVLTRLFPTADELLSLPPDAFAMPGSRRATLLALADAVDGGTVVIDPGADPDALAARLLAIRGVGDWTATYISMRALGDPDAFLPTDLGVLRGVERLGHPATPAAAASAAEHWRPWRSYAMAHLWSGTPTAGRTAPTPRPRHARTQDAA